MNLNTWDGNNINDGTNYQAILNSDAYGLPGVVPGIGQRQGSWPILGTVGRPGFVFHVDIYIRGASVGALQKQLMQWFDPDDEVSKQLVGEDSGGGNDRYIMGICEQLAEVPFSAGLHYVVSIRVDGDVKWRRTSTQTLSKNYTSTPEIQNFSGVVGEAPAYPKWKIKPTGAKSGSWPYKLWVAMRWNVDESFNQYPSDIANNSLDTQIASTNFALANGNDLRVWVDGIEVDRWLDGPDTATTKVWINLDMAARQEVTLDGAINNSVDEIDVNESIAGFPDAGLIRIDSETIVYTSKSNALKRFMGCTRGSNGTSAAAHSDNDDLWWIQHELMIVYGNSSAGSPPASALKKPMFELASSTNTSWDYNDFGVVPARAGTWSKSQIVHSPLFYTGNHRTNNSPWDEVGIDANQVGEAGVFFVGNPCGILSANYVNPETYTTVSGAMSPLIASSLYTAGGDWFPEYAWAAPGTADTWTDPGDRNETLQTAAKATGIMLVNDIGETCYLECADVTIALDSSNTPTMNIGSEQTNYPLDCTLYNSDTGKTIGVTFNMEIDETIQIDTDTKEVVYLKDNSKQFQALTILGEARRDWLHLEIGSSNPVTYTEPGMSAVTVDAVLEPRYHH